MEFLRGDVAFNVHDPGHNTWYVWRLLIADSAALKLEDPWLPDSGQTGDHAPCQTSPRASIVGLPDSTICVRKKFVHSASCTLCRPYGAAYAGHGTEN